MDPSTRTVRRVLTALAALAFLAPPAPAEAQQPDPCSGPTDAAFDFWVGDWEVRLPDGRLAGHNTVTRRDGGCDLTEDWRSAGGGSGRSLNWVDPTDGLWHQLWLDGTGQVLRLSGGAWRGGMRMEGHSSDTTGLHRVTWMPQDDGRVRQHWELSTDDGDTWSTLFDGYYARLPTAAESGLGEGLCDTPQGRRFDFWPGEWRVESRLRTPDGTWHETERVWRAERVMDGCGFIDRTTADFGEGPMSGVGTRFYDSAADEWVVTWTSTQAPGTIGVWRGRFDADGVGVFLRETETPNGVARSRIRWMNVTDAAADWDYSIQPPGQDGWTTAWEMKLRKLGGAR